MHLDFIKSYYKDNLLHIDPSQFNNLLNNSSLYNDDVFKKDKELVNYVFNYVVKYIDIPELDKTKLAELDENHKGRNKVLYFLMPIIENIIKVGLEETYNELICLYNKRDYIGILKMKKNGQSVFFYDFSSINKNYAEKVIFPDVLKNCSLEDILKIKSLYSESIMCAEFIYNDILLLQKFFVPQNPYLNDRRNNLDPYLQGFDVFLLLKNKIDDYSDDDFKFKEEFSDIIDIMLDNKYYNINDNAHIEAMFEMYNNLSKKTKNKIFNIIKEEYNKDDEDSYIFYMAIMNKVDIGLLDLLVDKCSPNTFKIEKTEKYKRSIIPYLRDEHLVLCDKMKNKGLDINFISYQGQTEIDLNYNFRTPLENILYQKDSNEIAKWLINNGAYYYDKTHDAIFHAIDAGNGEMCFYLYNLIKDKGSIEKIKENILRKLIELDIEIKNIGDSKRLPSIRNLKLKEIDRKKNEIGIFFNQIEKDYINKNIILDEQKYFNNKKRL